MNEYGLLIELLPVVGSFDWRFVEARTEGFSAETQRALRRAWERPPLLPLLEQLEAPPYRDWGSLVDGLGLLSDGAHPTAAGEVAEEWDRDAAPGREDPVGVALVAMCALAAWEGASGERLRDFPGGRIEPGWRVYPLLAARRLVAADALWGADALVNKAAAFLDVAQRDYYGEEHQDDIGPWVVMAREVRARWQECVEELAFDVWQACAPGAETFRPEVAALLWTLGDVPRAELMRPGSYVPTRRTVVELVATSMRRLRYDPLLQHIWLSMRDRPPFDLRVHKVLFAALNNVYRGSPLAAIDSTPMPSPSRAYARAAVEHFGGGASDEAAEMLSVGYTIAQDLIGDADPVGVVRLAFLWNLVLAREENRAEGWRELGRRATSILDADVRSRTHDQLDNCLAVPQFYLHDDDADPGAAVDDLECHRVAGIGYWLATAPPVHPDEGRRLQRLLAEEWKLLAELRSARFLRLLPDLPAHYTRFSASIRGKDPSPPEGVERREVRGSPLEYDPFDQDLALEEIESAWNRLRELWERMGKLAPDYAARRLRPQASMEQFATALVLDGLPPFRPGGSPYQPT